jgi:hypothetical protein
LPSCVEQQSRSLFKIETNAQHTREEKAVKTKTRAEAGERGEVGEKIAAEHCRCISSGGNGGERRFPFAPLCTRRRRDKHSCYIPNTRSKKKKIIVERRETAATTTEKTNFFFV